MASAGSPSNGNNGQQHDDSLDDFSLAPDGEGLDDDLDVDLAAAAELAAEGAEEEAGGGGGAAVDALGTDTTAIDAAVAAAMGRAGSGGGKGSILSGGLAGAGAVSGAMPPPAGSAAGATSLKGGVGANGDMKEGGGSGTSNGSSGGGGGSSSHRKSSGSRKVGKRQGSSSNKGGGRNSSGGREDGGFSTNERDEHPWKVGSTLEVITWDRKDKKFCDIVETAPISAQSENSDPAKRTKYYVHYHGLNRRMDEWIGADRVTKPPSVAKAQAKALKEEMERARKEMERDNSSQEVDLGIRTRRQKRKTGDGEEEDGGGPGGGGHGMHGGHPMNMDDDHDEHHGLDEASLKEHEEVTKVKADFDLLEPLPPTPGARSSQRNSTLPMSTLCG